MSRNNKLLISYIVLLALACVAFVLAVRLEAPTLTIKMERMGYALDFAKVLTIAGIIYYVVDFILGDKTSNKILYTSVIIVIQGIILFFLFN